MAERRRRRSHTPTHRESPPSSARLSAFEERSTVLEFDAGLPRAEAELEEGRITATYARNRGYLWASLWAVLADYPVLLCQVPQAVGTVDGLPLGVATVAVLKGRRVVRQGAFAGSQEVKA